MVYRGFMTHVVSVYRREGSDGGCARADCDCGWTTGKLEARDFEYVKREADKHEWRNSLIRESARMINSRKW